MKLNLGCGVNHLQGYVNVDVHPAAKPNVVHDLEQFPWPFEDSSVDEVVLNHVLEHLGADPKVFVGIFRELYRVCRPGALVKIVVPHPRHDHFLGDPTHVRAVTPAVLSLFSKANCAEWAKQGAANTPLAVYADVDFELRDLKMIVEPAYAKKPNLEELARHWNNVVVEYRMVLEVIKVPASTTVKRAEADDPEASPPTLVAPAKVQAMLEIAAQAAAVAPGGAFAEFGVYKGGTAWCLARLAREHGRELWLFDTFTGIPCADPAIDHHKVGDFGDTSLEAVKARIPDAIFVPGVFPESIAGRALPKFAFVHVDADQYASVHAACEVFRPLMLPGGVMWFDDYLCYTTPGATKAVDESFPGRVEFHRGYAFVRFPGPDYRGADPGMKNVLEAGGAFMGEAPR